jgi:hypothetical protein
MNRLKWLRFVNLLVIIDFLAVASSILLILYSPFDNIKAALSEVHEVGGKILIVLIAFHIILNWNWIQAQYLKKKKQAPKPAAKKSK